MPSPSRRTLLAGPVVYRRGDRIIIEAKVEGVTHRVSAVDEPDRPGYYHRVAAMVNMLMRNLYREPQ